MATDNALWARSEASARSSVSTVTCVDSVAPRWSAGYTVKLVDKRGQSLLIVAPGTMVS